MRCADCLFWQNSSCHLRPPEVHVVTSYFSVPRDGSMSYVTDWQAGSQYPMTHWPATNADDFCGEYYPKTAPRPKRYRELVAEIDDAID